MQTLVELQIEDSQGYKSRVNSNFVFKATHQPVEFFVYTVLRPYQTDSPVLKSKKERSVTDFPDGISRLNEVIWEIARLHPRGSYWLFADRAPKEMLDWLKAKNAPESFLAAVQKPEGGHLFVECPFEVALPISIEVGGHTRDFHFFALEPNCRTEQAFRQIAAHPSYFKRAFDMHLEVNLFVEDALFEVIPYGDENCEHIGITLSESLTREKARQIVQKIYPFPFEQRSFTWKEWEEWEYHHLTL